MKKFLHWLVDFLERKFPDRLEVRAADMQRWQKQMAELQARQQDVDVLLTQIQSNLNNLNTAMGFALPKAAMLER